jgi:hypothetical protein
MSQSSPKQWSPVKKFAFSRVFPWVFTLVIALIMSLSVEEIVSGWSSAKWPTVEGTITTSSVETHAGIGNKGIFYHPQIVYSYIVDGKQLTSNRVAFGATNTNDPSDAQRIVDKYPKGKTVTVSYDSDENQESLLEPGLRIGAWGYILLGTPFLLIGIAMIKVFPKLVDDKK